MRNVTALSILLPRLRGSDFDREILSEGIYPTNISVEDGMLALRYTFRKVRGGSPFMTFCMVLHGKRRTHSKIDYTRAGMEDAISATHFVNGILECEASKDKELCRESYGFDEGELERALDELYDW